MNEADRIEAQSLLHSERLLRDDRLRTIRDIAAYILEQRKNVHWEKLLQRAQQLEAVSVEAECSIQIQSDAELLELTNKYAELARFAKTSLGALVLLMSMRELLARVHHMLNKGDSVLATLESFERPRHRITKKP